jgi:hypothetical protein
VQTRLRSSFLTQYATMSWPTKPQPEESELISEVGFIMGASGGSIMDAQLVDDVAKILDDASTV